MFNVGPTELMVILVLALIVFGPKKLPEMGKSIGKGLKEFRKAQTEIKREISGALKEEPAGGSPAPEGTAGSPGSDGQGATVPDGRGQSEQPPAS
jgi:sec-independent protein translocase protein TatA